MSGAQGVIRLLGVVLFERTGESTFRPTGPVPDWVGILPGWDAESGTLRRGDGLSYLDNFLLDAEPFWMKSTDGYLSSGIWCLPEPGSEDVSFEAFALKSDGTAFLAIERLDERYSERRNLLQRARETRLSYEALFREVQKKDVLLHCIVHDLRGPLTGIVGALSLLRAREVQPERRKTLLELALKQAKKQERMIAAVLEVFAAEVDALESFELDPARVPDLRSTIDDVFERLRPAFVERGATLTWSTREASPDELRVVGRADRLERVLSNLLENALRFTGSGGEVRVETVDEGASVLVAVEDDGPGVPESVVDRLFDRFVSGRDKPGVAGLGLYYCRMTVEQWGGAIGYEPARAGGARFWFRLLKPVYE